MRRKTLFVPFVAVAAALTLSLVAMPSHAATPTSGSVGPADGSSTAWDFAPVAGAGTAGTLETVCAPPQCDAYALTIKLPQAAQTFYQSYTATLKIHYTWTQSVNTDLDVFAFDPSGNEVAGPGDPDTAAAGNNFEDLLVTNPVNGVWSIRSAAGVAPVPTAAHAVATLTFAALPSPPTLGTNRLDPHFANYDFPVSYQTRDGLQRPNGGEPNIGADWETGDIMYMSGTQVTRIRFSNNTKSAKATYTDVTPFQQRPLSEDSILFTDHNVHPNRTWALELYAAFSNLAYSDDGGANWTPGFGQCINLASSGGGTPLACQPDHETLGAGPFHAPAPSHSYPRAAYYCAQALVEAFCGLSTDGGTTFGGGAPLWNGACAAIHGHVRVGPTGVAYVPNGSCTDAKGNPRSGVSVSEDNGQSWTVHVIPDSGAGTSDPSVDEGPDGTVYFGYQTANGHPMVAVSHNHGKSWLPSIDVGRFQDPNAEGGTAHGIQNTEFAEVITGSPGRAAFAYLGTGTAGNDQAADFPGVWYLYVSYTYDGGKTWTTVNATPNDPVQRGCIWNGGGSNACRNLLDFNDITLDKYGRVYIAYTDGCTTTSDYNCDRTKKIDDSGCTIPSQLRPYTSTATCTYGRLSAVVRQYCGKGLISTYDSMLLSQCSAAVTTSRPVANPQGPGVARQPLPRTGSSPWLPVGAVVLAGSGVAVVAWRRRSGLMRSRG